MTSASPPPQSAGLGLSDVLNILWRRRLLILLGTLAGAVAGIVYGIVVTPLYIASATVQPGVTSFNAQAQPVREWQLKDISQWYKRGDYNPQLAVAMGEDPLKFRPIIRATFIPRGPQSRGGFTINLSTLSPGAQEAETILNRSVDVFNAFAGSDSAFSNIHLMRVTIRSNIERQTSKIQQIQGSKARVKLQIAAAQADIEAAEASKKLVSRKIAELEESTGLYDVSIRAHEQMLATVRSDVDDLGQKVAEWERIGAELTAERDRILEQRNPSDSAATLVFASSLGDIIGDIGDLRLGLFDQSERILEWENTARLLKVERKELEQEIEELQFERTVTIPREILELQQKAEELQIELDYDLPLEEQEAIQTRVAMQARLSSLTPLEQVGEAVASARPVRPRKARAVNILTLLAFASSVFGVFVLEYLSRNWRDITRSPRSA